MNRLPETEIRAVLFDWDDTLVGTIEAKWAQHKDIALTRYNHKLVDEDLRKHWGKPLHKMVEIMYAGDDFQGAIDSMMEQDDQGLYPKVLFDQTIGVLERLRAAKVLVGVVTSHLKIGFDRDLVGLGVPTELFDYIQTADATHVHKPDPAVFDPAKHWLAQQTIAARNAVYVGDSMYDAQAATEAGLQFIGCTSGLVTADEFQKADIPAISNLKDLLTLIG
jgi:phosphoglycolate phosphatase-like HAD superfamily hydrolase